MVPMQAHWLARMSLDRIMSMSSGLTLIKVPLSGVLLI